MKKNIQKLGALVLGLVVLASCEPEEKLVIQEIDTNIELPSSYEFDSRFNEGVSSVFYGGQVVRNMLIQDIKTLISDAASTPNTNLESDVLALYNYADNDMTTLTSVTGFNLTEDIYNNISTGKNLSGKVDPDVVLGYNETSEDLVLGWISEIDSNINVNGTTGTDVYISADSTDLSQLINKVLLSAVAYSQGTGKYLSIVLDEDNSTLKAGSSIYSAREHVWDEAFGYFGAARDYDNYTDDELASGMAYKDSDADGNIDLNSEYNFGFSTNAGKRDRIVTTTGIDPEFTTKCYEAFLAGRTAIANDRSDAEIRAYAEKAAQAWEKVIAATIIHYINDTKADLQDRIDATTTNKYDLFKHWSEMRGFTVGLQFGSEEYKLIDDGDLLAISNLMGTELASVLGGTNQDILDYMDDLDEIAYILRLTYNFDTDNVSNWKVSK